MMLHSDYFFHSWFYCCLMAWIILITLLQSAVLEEEVIYRVDPLALLSSTLRTYQKAGCDMDQVSLSCPRGTSISIEVAQYGNTIGGGSTDVNICASPGTRVTNGNFTNDSTEIEVRPSENCLSHALQYSLLQKVVESCQKKNHCKFIAGSTIFGGDPCPGSRKFVEVAYKCRPYEFRSKVACENDVIQLVCNPYSRIAVYSASFGRTEYESIQCTQPQGVKEETCLVSYATETVMQVCHGRRRCTITADSETFGNPCTAESRVYLKVVYTCIPRKVLKDRYEYSPELDEPQDIDLDQNHDDLYDEDQFHRESEAIPPAPKLHRELSRNRGVVSDSSAASNFEPATSDNPPIWSRDSNNLEVSLSNSSKNIHFHMHNNISDSDNDTLPRFVNSSINVITDKLAPLSPDCDEPVKPIGFIAEWINTYIFLAQNQEKFYLYLIISVTAGVLFCLMLVIGRLLIQKRRLKNDTKIQSSNTADTTLPNGFPDDISEIDADIDLTTPLPVPSVSRSEQNYNMYAPSPNPYGNLGQSNLSHTSTSMLVPSNSIIGSYSSATVGASNALMYPPNSTAPNGIPINHHYPSVYLGGSVMTGHGGTIRRARDYETTPPRILSKMDSDPQYFYG